jgi:hypothetical protein
VAVTADSLRGKIPLPKIKHPVLGWVLFLLGAVILFDSYGGGGPWPASTLFPW